MHILYLNLLFFVLSADLFGICIYVSICIYICTCCAINGFHKQEMFFLSAKILLKLILSAALLVPQTKYITTFDFYENLTI